MKIDVGLDKDQRKTIGTALGKVLADTFSLYLMTHNFHWNVTGPMFSTLHTLFDTQYNELWLALDEVAERIRQLGAPAPGTSKQIAALTSVKETDGVPGAMEMVRVLCDGNEQVCKSCREVLDTAEQNHDQVTVDLLTRRMLAHEKAAWMLRSLLE